MANDVVFNFGNESSSIKREEAVRLMDIYSKGYANADFDSIDTFISRVFSNSPDAYIVGTSAEEFAKGRSAITAQVKSDWENWGDLSLDVQSGIYSYQDTVCWFSIDGTVSMEIDLDACIDQLGQTAKETLKNDQPDRQACLSLAREMVDTVCEVAMGKNFIWPIRLTGVMAWEDTNFKIVQLHFSFPTSKFPDERIK